MAWVEIGTLDLVRSDQILKTFERFSKAQM